MTNFLNYAMIPMSTTVLPTDSRKEENDLNYSRSPRYIADSATKTIWMESPTPSKTKSYYVEGGFSHLIHMTAAHLW